MPFNRFNKVMTAVDILVIAFGAMIGWGWVVSTGGWIQNAGVIGTVLGFIAGGTMIFFVGMTYAELTPAIPKAGGEHAFSYKAFGVQGAFICTWALILSYLGVVCFEAVSLPSIVQYIFPKLEFGYMYTIAGARVYVSGIIISTIFNILIVLINIVGIKVASVFQTILTVIIALVGIILVASSIINGSSSNLSGQLIVGEGKEVIKNTISVTAVAPFFLFGFDVIPQVAEEINIPLKKVANVLLLSILCAVIFYSLVVLAVGYSLNADEISQAMSSDGLVTAAAMEKLFNSKLMAKALIIGGLCGVVTSWNSFLIGGSRAVFSMAESNMIPKVFSELHIRHKTPVNAVILMGGISMAAPFFGRTMLVWISNAASFACCVAYLIVSMSFLVLRFKEPRLYRPYRIKHFRLVGIIASLLAGIMVAIFLIPGSGGALKFQEIVIISIWGMLGALFYVFCKIKYRDEFGIMNI